MVLTDEIRNQRSEGDVQPALAWLDTDEYSNDDGAILLSDICNDYATTEWDIDIARLLLSRGVDANYCEGDNGWTLLHDAVSFARNEHTRKLYEALIGAGADVNARAHIDNTYITPLGALLEDPGRHRVWVPHGQSDIWVPGPDILHHYVETATMLLRAGASLDACCDDESAEEMLEAEEWNDLAEIHEPNYVALKALVTGVRRAGSWKLWTRENGVGAAEAVDVRVESIAGFEPTASFLSRWPLIHPPQRLRAADRRRRKPRRGMIDTFG